MTKRREIKEHSEHSPELKNILEDCGLHSGSLLIQWLDRPVLPSYMETQMTIEELEAKQKKAHDHLKPLEQGADYADAADAYEYAFDLVDDALDEAISHLKEYRKIIYPPPDRDILNPRS